MPNTTPLTYNGYVVQIATMAVVNTTTVAGVVVGVDDAFNAIIPQMLNYAELRIQRDLDLLPTQTTASYTLTTGSNTLTISTADFVTVQTILLANSTENVPLLPTTKEFLQNTYGSSSNTGVPAYYAMYGGDRATGGNTDNIIVLGPWPNSNYTVTLTGTIRAPHFTRLPLR